MPIERQMRHLNSNALCAIMIEHTGDNPRRCDIVEICVVLLDNFIRPSKKIIPFYNQIIPFRVDDIDFDTASVSKTKILNAVQNGMEPSISADRFEEWVGALDLPFRKKIIPLAYNWPVVREYMHTWLGLKNFQSLISDEYRDVMEAVYYINDCRNQVQRKIPYPRPEHLAYLFAQHGLDVRMSDDIMIKTQALIKLYSQLVGVHTTNFEPLEPPDPIQQ